MWNLNKNKKNKTKMKSLRTENLIIILYFAVALVLASIVTSCKSTSHIDCDAYGQVSTEQDTASK